LLTRSVPRRETKNNGAGRISDCSVEEELYGAISGVGEAPAGAGVAPVYVVNRSGAPVTSYATQLIIALRQADRR